MLVLVLCLLLRVHEIIFPLWVLAPRPVTSPAFPTYRHLDMRKKSLRSREGSRRAQGACRWGQLWSFFLLLVVILRSEERGAILEPVESFLKCSTAFCTIKPS